MGHASKRKLQAAANRSLDLPESLKFVPSVDAPTNGPHTKRQKTEAQPSSLSRAQDTHLLGLQSEQLLKAISRKPDADDSLAKLGDSIVKAIRAIPDTKAIKLKEVYLQSEQCKVAVPFASKPADDLQLNFQYCEPESINITGLAHDMMRNRSYTDELEVLVELPASIIQEKDYLNYRIHYKMAFYLFTIARSMKSKYELSYIRRTVFGGQMIDLQVKYKDRQVLVRLSLPFDIFPEHKLEPSKNADRSIEGSTPEYNAHVMLLMRLSSLYEMITSSSQESPNFRDSVLLAEKFLSRRSLPIHIDQWATITACLLKGGGKNGGKLLSPNASAVQLFRGTMLFLSQFFESSNNSITFGDAQSAPGCWIRGLNLFSGFTDQQKHLLGEELKFTSALLVDETKDAIKVFEKVFLEDQNKIGYWDLQFTMRDGTCRSADLERMWRTLRKALAERAPVISVSRPNHALPVPISDEVHDFISGEINIGMKLKRPYCQSTMILGPPANDSSAKSFRSFWGTLAELRKFQDGRILETVALSSNNPSLDICQKILGLHFPTLPDLGSWTVYGADSADELKLVQDQKKLIAEFDEFARLARDLEDLPLRITSISSSDAIFAASAARIPDTIDGVIDFESSARWPDDIEAMQRMKVAFLLALEKPFATVEELSGGTVKVSNAVVMLENQSSTVVNSTSKSNLLNLGVLQLTMGSGLKYNLRIHLDREKTLLSTYLKSAQAKNDPLERARHQEALEVHERLFVTSSLHSDYVRNIPSSRPAYSEAVILLKQWFAAHLLENHCSDQVVELIALNVVKSDTESTSDSPTAVFYRMMQFLASWDWRQDSIMLEQDVDKRKLLENDFSKLKEQNPAHSIAIYPPYASPVVSCSRAAALRMTSLARASHERLQQGASIESIFSTPLNHFDFVIHFSITKKSSKYKNIETAKDDKLQHIQTFVDELQDIYGQALWIFTARDASCVAAVIEPALLQPRNFKPNLGFPTKPVDSEIGLRVVLDVDVMMAEIERLGQDLIARIDRKKL